MAKASDYQSELDHSITCTIASSGTSSTSADLSGAVLVAVEVDPAGWTAADIAIYGSLDGTTYGPLKNMDGTAIKLTSPSAGDIVDIPPIYTDEVRYVKFVASVAQAAARTLTLSVRPV